MNMYMDVMKDRSGRLFQRVFCLAFECCLLSFDGDSKCRGYFELEEALPPGAREYSNAFGALRAISEQYTILVFPGKCGERCIRHRRGWKTYR